jgi:hypothetical protein
MASFTLRGGSSRAELGREAELDTIGSQLKVTAER